jgi:hypothetical protein
MQATMTFPRVRIARIFPLEGGAIRDDDAHVLVEVLQIQRAQEIRAQIVFVLEIDIGRGGLVVPT